MSILNGADSELPQPGLEGGREIWGIYIAGNIGHVWQKSEIENLGRAGVRAVLPIVVPPQSASADGWWWTEDEGAQTIVRLVAEARAWGLQGGSPLCFDFEEGTAEAMIGVDRTLPAKVEARVFAACTAYGYHGWTYGGKTWHDAVGAGHKCHRWLAAWEKEAGEVGKVPTSLEGYGAIQYAGRVEGGRVDLDVFQGGLEYTGCDGTPALFGEAEQLPKAQVEEATSSPTATDASPAAEASPVDTTGTTEVSGSDAPSESTSNSPLPSADDTSLSSESATPSDEPAVTEEVPLVDPTAPTAGAGSAENSNTSAPSTGASAPDPSSSATDTSTTPADLLRGLAATLTRAVEGVLKLVDHFEESQ